MDKLYLQSSVDEYISELSGRSIVPGGGSASALAAAVGAGLNLMVINFSEDLSEDKDVQQKSLERLKMLVDKDCSVFKKLMGALSSKTATQEDYKDSASVPLEVCVECCRSLEITSGLIAKANKKLISDIGCASRMLTAAFHSAKLNVEINLSWINDTSFVEDAVQQLKNMKESIDDRNSEIISKVEDVMDRGRVNG